MDIMRIVDGKSITFTLTPTELRLAYTEQQEEYDCENAKMALSDYLFDKRDADYVPSEDEVCKANDEYNIDYHAFIADGLVEHIAKRINDKASCDDAENDTWAACVIYVLDSYTNKTHLARITPA